MNSKEKKWNNIPRDLLEGERKMPFVGILSDKKNEKEFNKLLTERLQKEQIKTDIICINNNSIDNLKNVKFDTILIDKEDISKYEEKLKNILKDANYLIINSDLMKDVNILKDLNLSVITYGFNSKATITASSIEDGNNILCLQRNIKASSGEIIEQQEIMVDFISSNRYIDMGITSIILLYKSK